MSNTTSNYSELRGKPALPFWETPLEILQLVVYRTQLQVVALPAVAVARI